MDAMTVQAFQAPMFEFWKAAGAMDAAEWAALPEKAKTVIQKAAGAMYTVQVECHKTMLGARMNWGVQTA